METIAVSKHDRIQKLVETLTNCRAELDSLGADVAAAHVETALHALQNHISQAAKPSNTE